MTLRCMSNANQILRQINEFLSLKYNSLFNNLMILPIRTDAIILFNFVMICINQILFLHYERQKIIKPTTLGLI